MLTFALENSQMKKRYTEEQIIAVLQEVERSGTDIRSVVRKHNISEQTFYRWRAKYGGMDVSDAKKLKGLESENAKLKKLLAEQLLVIEGLKDFNRGKG
jgi:putative transposase